MGGLLIMCVCSEDRSTTWSLFTLCVCYGHCNTLGMAGDTSLCDQEHQPVGQSAACGNLICEVTTAISADADHKRQVPEVRMLSKMGQVPIGRKG
jgi:hypothetical protein